MKVRVSRALTMSSLREAHRRAWTLDGGSDVMLTGWLHYEVMQACHAGEVRVLGQCPRLQIPACVP